MAAAGAGAEQTLGGRDRVGQTVLVGNEMDPDPLVLSDGLTLGQGEAPSSWEASALPCIGHSLRCEKQLSPSDRQATGAGLPVCHHETPAAGTQRAQHTGVDRERAQTSSENLTQCQVSYKSPSSVTPVTSLSLISVAQTSSVTRLHLHYSVPHSIPSRRVWTPIKSIVTVPSPLTGLGLYGLLTGAANMADTQ